MYNNNTKHSILKSLNIVRINQNEFSDSYISTDLVYANFSTGRPALWKKDEFDLGVINLAYEGYLERKRGSIGFEIKFTEKGHAAFTDNIFIKDNNKLLFNTFKDSIMLICNLVIAVAGIVALNKNSENNKVEFKHIETRIDSITKLIRRDKLVALVKPPISSSRVDIPLQSTPRFRGPFIKNQSNKSLKK